MSVRADKSRPRAVSPGTGCCCGRKVEVLPKGFDTVVTLCGEQECPMFPGNVRRLHWALPDPAAVST
jgi:hypothetical protein